LSDLLNYYFTGTLSSNLALKIPPHRYAVHLLPCELLAPLSEYLYFTT